MLSLVNIILLSTGIDVYLTIWKCLGKINFARPIDWDHQDRLGPISPYCLRRFRIQKWLYKYPYRWNLERILIIYKKYIVLKKWLYSIIPIFYTTSSPTFTYFLQFYLCMVHHSICKPLICLLWNMHRIYLTMKIIRLYCLNRSWLYVLLFYRSDKSPSSLTFL